MGKSGGGGRTTETVSRVELSPEQQAILNKALPVFERTLRRGVNLPEGSQIAGFTPEELQAQEMARQYANIQLPQLTSETLANQSFLQSGQAGTLANPALREAINAATAPIYDNLTQTVFPAIRGEAITASGLGGSRQGLAEGLAATGAFRAAGETAAPIANEAFLRGLQAQTTALGLAPQSLQLGLAPSNVLSLVGGQQREMEQSRLIEEANKYVAQQLLPFELAKQTASAAVGLPLQSNVVTGTAPAAQGVSKGQAALGGAASGAAIGTAIMPGWGTAIGAVGGGLMGLFAS